MAKIESPAVLRDIDTLFHVGTSIGLTDAQLLDRFRARADLKSSEAAFVSLMARHGPMVLGVCRRALRNPDDVADAFQATFLILVRKADTVRVEDSLGRWLYGVSRRVSVRAKLAATRRSAREVRGIESAAAPAANADVDELRHVLDEEIGRLPEKFRSAVVLCELEGLGHDEAARQLGCAVGTVKSRLNRAREKLRSRLIRRGVAPTAFALNVESTSAAVPAVLMEATVKAAIGYADVAVSPAVTLLIQGVLRAMFLNKLCMVAITVVASLALATSAGVLARQAAAPLPEDEPGGQRAEQKVVVEKESGSTVGSSATPFGEPSEQADEFDDRLELLRLDVQLLSKEVVTRRNRIQITDNDLVTVLLNYGENDQTRAQIESLKKSLEVFRKDYISKSKELRQKQLELDELRQRQMKELRQKQLELDELRQRQMAEQRQTKTDS